MAGALGLRQADLVSPSSALYCLVGHHCPSWGSHTPTCGVEMTPTSQGWVRVTATEMQAHVSAYLPALPTQRAHLGTSAKCEEKTPVQ